MYSTEQLKEAFEPVLAELREKAAVAASFIDKNFFQVSVATLWANVVLSPEDTGITEDDLPNLHDVLNEEIASVLGPDEDLKTVFRFISSKDGEKTMVEARLNQTHKDLLLYFSSMILDPEGHRKWADELKEKQKR